MFGNHLNTVSANADKSSSFDASKAPVFILGMHRSGTTVLYEMLAALGYWNTLWAWHIASYDEIRSGNVEQSVSQARFVQRLADAGMETRGVDSVKASPQTKEEYCFIMDNKGFGNTLSKKGFKQFQEICQTVQSTQPTERPLLLKNPWDFGNAHVIRQLIPTARFVYIHRHPIETVDSMWRFLNGVLLKPNHYMEMLSTRYSDITRSRVKRAALQAFVQRLPGVFVNCLISWFGKSCDGYLKSIDLVPESERIEISYNELCTEPNATMARIRQHFNIVDIGIDFSEMISPRSARIDAPVLARAPKIERRMKAYIVKLEQLSAKSQRDAPALD
jgi:hypothetical protein